MPYKSVKETLYDGKNYDGSANINVYKIKGSSKVAVKCVKWYRSVFYVSKILDKKVHEEWTIKITTFKYFHTFNTFAQ